jgi:hypothetical protein
MARVNVFQFKKWSQESGAYVLSERLATREAIKASSELVLVPEGSLEIDSSLLDGNGMTRPLPTPD